MNLQDYTIDIIADTDFNKFATLNIEFLLIECMSADAKYKLQNGNAYLSNHTYYKKPLFKIHMKRGFFIF
ncbi:MAG: hypothetical protein ACRC6T_05990 [Sarcina sp.]